MRITIAASDKGPGGKFILSRKDGIPVLKKRIHARKKTDPAQKRAILQDMSLVEAWRALPQAIQSRWGENPTAAEEHFIKFNTDRLNQHKPMRICRSGDFFSPVVQTSQTESGTVIISYNMPSAPRYLTVFIQRHGLYRAFSFDKVIGDALKSPVEVEDLTPGKDVSFHCVFSDKPIEKAEKISAAQIVDVRVE